MQKKAKLWISILKDEPVSFSLHASLAILGQQQSPGAQLLKRQSHTKELVSFNCAEPIWCLHCIRSARPDSGWPLLAQLQRAPMPKEG